MSPLKDLAHLASVLQTRLANVKKRSGRLEPFEPAKIETSIRRALSAAGLKDDKWAVEVSRTVFGRLDQMVEQGREISTADLSELIQILFIESNLPQAVRKFLQFHQTKLEVKARGGELAAVRAGKGLSFSRFFTREGTHPFDEIRWEHRDATISNEKGEVVFEQKGVEMPAFWTQTATNIVVQKYFRGQPNSIERETSVRQLISRVATTIADWGRKDGYFKTIQDADVFENELTSVLVNQRAAFNSPVWFNMGAEPRPQCSACFVNSVHDDMHSILNLTITEGILFKYGSGTGSNISNLRSSREPVSSSSGRASGPVSFMKGWDAFAGVIKSGGRTRRAAKMVILNADHPDILDFIWCKAKEEKKAHALIEMGYDPAFNSDDSRSAYGSIFYQNANNTVRLPDEFFQAAECNGSWQTRFVTTGEVCETMPAKEVLNQISEAAWLCGDPGVQYDSAIQKWHTCKNSGRINATNPCCLTGDTLIAVADGRNAVPIQELAGQEVPVYTWDHNTERVTIGRMNNIGVKRHNVPVFRVTLDDGSSFRATDDHLIMLRDGTYRQVKDLRAGDSLMPFHSRVRQNSDWRTARRFVSIGSGWRVQYRWIWEWLHGKQPAGYHIHHKNFNALDDRLENLELLAEEEHIAIHRKSMIGDRNPARRLMNDQWRANIARAVQGERNPHYGKLHTKEALEKMRAASARRWQSPFQISCASQAAKTWMKAAKALGQHIGRYPLPRLMRCCPVCRENFETIREGQLFCSFACRYSQLGLEIVGAKVGAANRGRSLSPEHKEKLRLASIAASRPEDKQRAQRVSLRARCAKAARALEAEGYSINFSQWDGLRPVVRAAGVPHAPCVKIVRQFFSSEADLREAAELYNHTITEVVFDSIQDVYDGTVDQHHNFGIVTSRCPSVASRVGGEDFSGIFVHNSEFVFLDDSACNLSSINLMKFRTADGGFDVEAYKHTIRIMTTAMEIIVDNSSYPTPAIEQNSHDFRPLGLGFANLGALLMSYGIPYDSDEGRNIAAAVSSLMSGEAYWQSTQTAQALGAFVAYEENREPFMEVMRLHRGAVYQLSPTGVPEGLFQECRAVWDRMIEQCEKHGARNAQISVVAPTGTIAFLMDCDTTGIEPDIALVKYKWLVGGGMVKIVNRTVPLALEKLGYTESQREEILAYIDKNDTIEGAPHLNKEHLPIFDCAFKPARGTRTIHHLAHVKMMAAVQPFISGAISKTVNMPETSTAQEISDVYALGWKMGLKAIAIYRDNCKKSQPLTTKKESSAGRASARPDEFKPRRRRLPDERRSITHKFMVGGYDGYLTVGLYNDGVPGEIFITMSKQGSVISGLMGSFATAVSIALQYGVPVRVLVNKFAHSRFEPSGFTNNPSIRIAKSIVDYVFRWLGMKFLSLEDQRALGVLVAAKINHDADELVPSADENDAAETDEKQTSLFEKRPVAADQGALAVGSAASAAAETTVNPIFTFDNQSDAPACDTCGAIMVRNASCYKCLNCGNTSGCS